MRSVIRIAAWLCALVIMSACTSPWQSAASPEEQTVEVRRETLSVVVSDTGIVKPARRSDLFFSSDGVIRDVLVEEGHTVKQGQGLARLDTHVLQGNVDACSCTTGCSASSA